MTYAWIKGYLSYDVDGDNTELNTTGNFDQGVAGQTVSLLDVWGNVVATTTTDQYGGYQFDVLSGMYSVKFPSIDGYEYAAKDQGSDFNDSDASANGVTDTFYVFAGQTKMDLDAVIQATAPANTGGGSVGDSICIEAEDLWTSGFHVAHGDNASGGCFLKLNGAGGQGDASTTFNGPSGTYDLTIRAQDENDGQSTIMVKVNGHVVGTVVLDRDNNGGGSDHGDFSDFTLTGLNIQKGDTVGVWVDGDYNEFVRLDKFTFDPVTAANNAPSFDNLPNDGMLMIHENTTAVVDIDASDLDGDNLTYAIVGGIDEAFFNIDAHTGALSFKSAPDFEHPLDENGNNKYDVTVEVTDGNGGSATKALWVQVKDVDETPALGMIGGRVTNDVDLDDTENAAGGGFDAGFAGETVKLLDAAGNVVRTTTTDTDGAYKFNDVPAGDYKVMFTPVAGFDIADKGVGAAKENSDANQDGMTDVFTLSAGGMVLNVDLSLQETPPAPGSLSGRYFMDSDDDNQDNGEMGVAGVAVMLLDAAGNATGATTTTDANGDYSFGNLAAGTYGVKFTDPAGVLAGKQLVTANQGPDGTDSDAIGDTTQSVISAIDVTAGNDTPDNDAGAEDIPPQLGSLSGRFFRDEDRDGQDNDGANGVDGVAVFLFDLSSGTPVATGDQTTTGADGSYSFTDLVPGDAYAVLFVDDVTGDSLTAQDVGDDATDSDAFTFRDNQYAITDIVVVANQDTPNNDAGVVAANEAPVAADDAAKTCSDEAVKVDVLANDTDADNDALTITEVNGQAIVEGGTVTVNGVDVMLMGGELQFDGSGSAALEALDINQSTTVSIDYTVSDGNGGTGTATADIEFCGTANTVASLEASLPAGDIKFQIIDENNPSPQTDEMWTMKLSQTGDARFEGLVIQEAYCVAVFDSVQSGLTGTDIDAAPMLFGSISVLDDMSIVGSTITNIKTGVAADQVDNMINWILNQDFASQGFTDAEIQGAIWGLTDDLAFVAEGGGDLDDAIAICDAAVANGGDFVAGAGDVIGLYIDPNAATEAGGHAQPFVVAVNYDDIDCIC